MKFPYNVAILISTAEPGGAEQQAIMLARELSDRFNLALLVIVAEIQPVELSLIDVDFIRLEVRVKPSSFFQIAKAAIKLRRELRRNDIDVLLPFGTPLSLFSFIALIGGEVSIVVCERIVPWLHHSTILFKFARRWLYRSASAIVCQTETIAGWYREQFKDTPCHIISNLSRKLVYKNDVNLKFTRNIVCVARMRKQKAQERLIKSFAAIKSRFPEWGITFVGGGELLSELTTFTQQLGLANRIHFVGDVPDAIPYLCVADLFVLSSHYEGYPNALSEAMQLGKPCIAYRDAVQHTNMIEPGVNGWLCESNPDNLSDYLILAMESETLRRDVGERAKLSSEATANTRIVSAWVSVIETAYSGRKKTFGN